MLRRRKGSGTSNHLHIHGCSLCVIMLYKSPKVSRGTFVTSIVPLNEKAEGVSVALLTDRGYTITADRVAFRSKVLRRVKFARKGKLLRPYVPMRVVIPNPDSLQRDIVDALEGLNNEQFPTFEIRPPHGGLGAILARVISVMAFVLFAYGMLNGIAIPMVIRSNVLVGQEDPQLLGADKLQLFLSEHGFKVPRPGVTPSQSNQAIEQTEGVR